ncbi:MAG: DUF5069 domain-containing protein [Roseibacillus sp.]
MSESYPCSPRVEIDGLPYFQRMVEKIRLHAAGDLHPELHDNLGHGMDLWICQFLGVNYSDLKEVVLSGASDQEALAHAKANGTQRADYELAWFRSYILNRGFRDDFAEKLTSRIEESGFQDKKGILSFCDYIDADEGRL